MTTKTRDQALAEIDARAAEDRNKFIQQYEAKEAIGVDVSGYEPPFVHYGKLYDTAGSVHFRAPYSSGIAEGKAPTPDLLRDLLAAHPPLPMARYERGSVSYRTEGGLSDKDHDEGRTVPIFPVHFRVGLNSFDNKVEVHWIALLNGARWRFQVDFPAYGLRLGHAVARADRDPMGRITRILEATWKSEVPGIQVTRYASGSFDTFPSIILWWHLGADLDIPALVGEVTP